MKILYLTFYFEPDLCAGSFRNTPIVRELAARKELSNGRIDVLTTMPNRYSTYQVEAQQREVEGNIHIYRIPLSSHKSGFWDQIISFQKYFSQTLKIVKNNDYDLVIASSSRLFTAYLGARIARRKKLPFFLDIRDLFRDTITDIFKNKVLVFGLNQLLKRIEKYTFGYASHINLVSEGFASYFDAYKQCSYSFHTNGIDEVFLTLPSPKTADVLKTNQKRTILYAGNIGEGQGLHHIIPEVANELEDHFDFVVIGDGGAKPKLEERIATLGCKNVCLLPPMKREQLIEQYFAADFLFVHLNDLKAFEKVLPSKIFEYAAFNKPMIAGLSGYASSFVKEHVQNHIMFPPCDANTFIGKLTKYNYKNENRTEFKKSFARKSIVKELVNEIINVCHRRESLKTLTTI